MILRAAETARSLLEPTTKLSRVYLWLRPVSLKLDFELVVVLRIVRTRSLMTDSLLVISRERILVLALFWTSKSRLATGRLLFSRDFLMISEYRLRSCLTKKVFLTPMRTSLAHILLSFLLNLFQQMMPAQFQECFIQ